MTQQFGQMNVQSTLKPVGFDCLDTFLLKFPLKQTLNLIQTPLNPIELTFPPSEINLPPNVSPCLSWQIDPQTNARRPLSRNRLIKMLTLPINVAL
jgi:hypothetical protein